MGLVFLIGLCVARKADKRVPSTTPYRYLLGSVTSWLNGISYTNHRIKTPCSSPWALMRLANSHSVCPVHATDKKPHGLVILISSLWLMTNRKSAHRCMLNEGTPILPLLCCSNVCTDNFGAKSQAGFAILPVGLQWTEMQQEKSARRFACRGAAKRRL